MPTAERGTTAARLSRRRLLGSAVTLVSVVLAACAPATSLPPTGGGRVTRAERRERAVPVQGADATPEPTVPPRSTAAGRSARSTSTPTAPVTTSAASDGSRGRRPATQRSIVRFLHGWEGAQATPIESMVAEFGQRPPNVTVETEIVAPERLRDTVIGITASGTPLDVAMLRGDAGPYLLEQGQIQPLNDRLSTDGIGPDRYRPDELAARSWDGHVAGLPHTLGGAEQLLYVNTGLLERLDLDQTQPVQSWQQLEALVEPARRVGLIAIDPTRCGAAVPALAVWTYANGGRWLADFDRRVSWDEPAAVEAAEWVKRMVQKQRGGSAPPLADRPREPLSVADWLTEKHVCCVNGADWIAVLGQSAPQMSVAVFELPRNEANPASDGRSPSYGGWMLSLLAAARNREAAWTWLAYLGASDAADRLAQAQGRPSPRAPTTAYDVRESESGGPFGQFERVVAASRAHSALMPRLPIAAELEEIGQAALQEIVSRSEAAGPRLDAATRSAQQRLDEWQARRQAERSSPAVAAR
ncbi:MAG: extracellular solute-binding protein [Chloroflexi bacterium]|nr:extracellular solute-binding protein [Chloroflexota bacterium]